MFSGEWTLKKMLVTNAVMDKSPANLSQPPNKWPAQHNYKFQSTHLLLQLLDARIPTNAAEKILLLAVCLGVGKKV